MDGWLVDSLIVWVLPWLIASLVDCLLAWLIAWVTIQIPPELLGKVRSLRAALANLKADTQMQARVGAEGDFFGVKFFGPIFVDPKL